MSGPLNGGMDGALFALIEESLALWGLEGTVRRDSSGAIVVETGRHHALVARAAPGVPFRWSIVVDGRQRVAGSVVGLLRVLRLGIDPDFRPSRVRIAPLDVGWP